MARNDSSILDEAARLEIINKDMEREKADNVLDELIKDRQFRELLISKLQSLDANRT